MEYIKKKNFYIFFVVLLLAIFTSCSDNSDIENTNFLIKNVSIKNAFDENQNFIDGFNLTKFDKLIKLKSSEYSHTKLSYKFDGGEPFQLYVISTKVNISNAKSQSGSNFYLSLNTDDNYDGYNINYDFLKESPPLSSGIYNYESFLHQLLENLKMLENNNDWENIKETLTVLRSNEIELNAQEQFQLFTNFLSKKCGFNISKTFSESEWETLSRKFNVKD